MWPSVVVPSAKIRLLCCCFKTEVMSLLESEADIRQPRFIYNVPARVASQPIIGMALRSEERRVGKEV